MKRITYYVVAFATLVLGCNSLALGGIAQVTVIDRETGAVLTPHAYHGEYWVAGRPGAHYAVEIRNRTGERVLAVASVDGVNVISGETADWDQTGYVLEPGDTYQITGWRKSDTEVAAFTFTASDNSYAERTGRPANVGVIGVAIFRERPAPRIAEREFGRRDVPVEDAAAASVSPPPDRFLPEPVAPKLGTGHGDREYSFVTHTQFTRKQDRPNEIIRIRYDSLNNLVAMGIIPRPRPHVATVNPFPGSAEEHYVADPPTAGLDDPR
jgi:hypothetical protein